MVFQGSLHPFSQAKAPHRITGLSPSNCAQQESKVLILLPGVATGNPQDQLKVLSTLLEAHWMPLKSTTFQNKTLNNEGRCKSHCLINQFAIGPNF